MVVSLCFPPLPPQEVIKGVVVAALAEVKGDGHIDLKRRSKFEVDSNPGLDPTQIKHVLVGHGHNDHVGGVSYIQDTYPGADIMLTAADWDLSLANPRPDRPRPTRDVEVTHGQTVTLGDTTVTLAVTPGHTPGSLGIFIPVTHNGASDTVLLLSTSSASSQPRLAVQMP